MTSQIYSDPVHPWAGMENRVRYYRFLRNEMSQAVLAERVGVSRQTIVAIERGNYNPSVALALRLGRALSAPVEELFVLEGGEQ